MRSPKPATASAVAERQVTSTITCMTAGLGRPLVVMAYLDGRRERGYLFNFSSKRDLCQLFRSANGTDRETIELRKLKAIFFLREEAELLSGRLPTMQPGRRLEVRFNDNEHIRGIATSFERDRLGFFMFPEDPGGKISRIFVINANARLVQWL
jgi:hypothetical protein